METATPTSQRYLIKGGIIAALILILLIPASLLRGLVREREARQQQVVAEVSSKWAGGQTIVGPILAVPYNVVLKGADGRALEQRKMAYFLPDALRVKGNVQPEERHRSLYTVALYRSGVSLTGRFNALPLQTLGLAPEQMVWSDARLMLGLADPRGLEEEVVLQWAGTSKPLESGMPQNRLGIGGLSVPVSITAQGSADFSINLKLKGSDRLYFTPVGRTTEVTLSSPWKDPAFDGQYLPSTSTINQSGFQSNWKVLHVARTYGQSWSGDGQPEILKSAFGVRFVQPTDGYAKTDRSVKYAILFIGLTFALAFFIETLQKRPVHPLQYGLVGAALCVFYTLLLSISEYTAFNTAYAIAAVATVALISGYMWSLFEKVSVALTFAGVLGGLYGYIFILLQLQDYSLLFGSIGLFAILAALMWASRKVDWYGVGRKPQAAVA